MVIKNLTDQIDLRVKIAKKQGKFPCFFISIFLAVRLFALQALIEAGLI